ncbi:27902_t:CDS:2 [Dentiscutata erythropus]|uniref:27902_t:CDS:1 n=1 Tax=Dentiscutata erythropus TaxID=1348616 RepID=A0A9N9GCK8_9GLOM|nr:27902_t:CDS:2 [Dentiscutata erythropus]
MPCYADTIVRVKFVRQNAKEDTNLLVVWALGAYPVEREDYNIEMTSFLPLNLDDRDPESQAVFAKDNFFSVGMTVSTSTHVTVLNKVADSNKCPLKVSLVGIPRELPNQVKDDAIFQISITDYVGQEVTFNMKVVFPCNNSRFAYVKDNIWPKESFIFVVGQLEIIMNEFYVYARDIYCIDTQSVSKKNVFGNGVSCVSPSTKNTVRSKLLASHDNFIECLKDKSENSRTTLAVSSDDKSRVDSKFSGNSYSFKRVRVEDANEFDEEFCEEESGMFQNFAENSKGGVRNETVTLDDSLGEFVPSSSGSPYLSRHTRVEILMIENVVKDSVCYKGGSRGKGKERADGSLRFNLRSRSDVRNKE